MLHTDLGESSKPVQELKGATVRLVGDSGDGMQLSGMQLTNTSALAGNDIATFPDFPAEIRAPRGTRAGVSGFQVHFSSEEIFTPGDGLDALVCMNPAALVTNLRDLKPNGLLIVNDDSFEDKDLKLAKLARSPLDDGTVDGYRLIRVKMTQLTRDAVAETKISVKEADRCKNFFAMGLVFWLYGRDMTPTLRFIEKKFAGKLDVATANRLALLAGWNFGETTEAFPTTYQVPAASLPSGTYRSVIGNQALTYGLMTAAKLSGKKLFLGSYPITPASDVLHELSRYKSMDVLTFQAEDEIAAICSIIGAAFAGQMGVTTSSGPGILLKGEGMSLGVMMELPMLIIDVQRGGPSTGLPTKTEQADLLMAIHGRHGECPMPVIAAAGPADCFDVAIEAWRVATRLMTPVMILSDGYIANGSEPWRIPDVQAMEPIVIQHPTESGDEKFLPYKRDALLARPWAIPGTEGLMHRLGGLEKEDRTGNVSYDAANHQHMVNTRAQKVRNVNDLVAPPTLFGQGSGDVLVVSWGGTFGACRTAVAQLQAMGQAVSHLHLRWVNPLPSELGSIMAGFQKIVIPELNTGQLRQLVQGQFLVAAHGINKVEGKPFSVSELMAKIQAVLAQCDAVTTASV
jgi:2-oxoglutarate/2-oxoacid ferredoxin oxidoreductase subunit alpha